MTKAAESKQPIAWGRYLLVFFVAAWMFVLGVLVGRGTAPVTFDTQALQKELADLRNAMMQKEQEAVEKAIRGEDEQEPLEFYEALKTEESDTAVAMPVPQTTPAEPSPVSKEIDKAGTPPHKKRATLMPKGERAVKLPTPVQPRETKEPSTATGTLTLQVASLKDGAAAEQIVANLKKDGYPAFLARSVIPGKGLWFRVRVGSYATREQAAADIERLTRDGKKPMLVKK
ncbi:SPOR domain-containing protein [Desulfosarcina widdelii]|uniref:SPOR domain-containing protein n=1 Tax=Desulfosarcina widdelii TaxID=947919 RepID=A0A5K7Z7W3_9BACT|nr:SPOR domain-containing protein [Desulfosarcina widdelii]BBO76249.1 SPOR domain-containing protein [Desulfosarcina widdelii]